ncbi:hypothetical protein EYC84_000108 [Monilinia fructicola]|uniref:Uncharacterized protein n=1 Tax=Monilinia fructicola TaxID=38448 RepID=A0A5M9JSD8_MONFR|nr:hypothetical protein EYC84_000108 [Monilinia fructicola]
MDPCNGRSQEGALNTQRSAQMEFSLNAPHLERRKIIAVQNALAEKILRYDRKENHTVGEVKVFMTQLSPQTWGGTTRRTREWAS